MVDPEILDDPYIPPPFKPPLETKRDKFERIWKSSTPQIDLLIQKSLRYKWNFTQSKTLYMNMDCSIHVAKTPLVSDRFQFRSFGQFRLEDPFPKPVSDLGQHYKKS